MQIKNLSRLRQRRRPSNESACVRLCVLACACVTAVGLTALNAGYASVLPEGEPVFTPPHDALAVRFNLHLMNKVVREFARRAANVYLSWRSLPPPADKTHRLISEIRMHSYASTQPAASAAVPVRSPRLEGSLAAFLFWRVGIWRFFLLCY